MKFPYPNMCYVETGVNECDLTCKVGFLRKSANLTKDELGANILMIEGAVALLLLFSSPIVVLPSFF
jgi:hypothetical protein